MNQKVFKRRVYVSLLFLMIITIFFVVKLFNLHFSGRIIVSQKKKPEVRRGYIYDRNGLILAMSIETGSLFVNPSEIRNPARTAVKLSPHVGIGPTRLEQAFRKKRKFLWIKRKLDEETVSRIKRLNLQGVHFRKEYKRVYPGDNLASNVLGFTGVDNRGLEGIEYSMDGYLRAEKGDLPVVDNNQILRGYNIFLTIDRFVQHISEKELGKAVELSKARQGAVIVMDVSTGRILALARYPDYNPNFYRNSTQFQRRNFTVIDSFEPGSTQKILTLAALLEHYPSALNKKYLCTGAVQIADTTINCTHVHGLIGMKDIIKYSCNAGIIQAVRNLPAKDLYETLSAFGFGRETGAGLPGESRGILRHPDKWSGLSKYSLSFGHELSVTSLQLAAAFSCIGNEGVYIAPSIINRIEDGNGVVFKKNEPVSRRRIIKKRTALELLEYMKGVVQDGTGMRASVDFYGAAGKTGTSKKYSKKGGVYSDRVISSFIGLAPVKNPGVCILVVIDDPAEKLSGGRVAAPVFSSIAERILPVMGYSYNGKSYSANMPFRSKADDSSLTGKMPDLKDMTLAEAVNLLVKIRDRYNLSYRIKGVGRVYYQSPQPGDNLKKAKGIELKLK